MGIHDDIQILMCLVQELSIASPPESTPPIHLEVICLSLVICLCLFTRANRSNKKIHSESFGGSINKKGMNIFVPLFHEVLLSFDFNNRHVRC